MASRLLWAKNAILTEAPLPALRLKSAPVPPLSNASLYVEMSPCQCGALVTRTQWCCREEKGMKVLKDLSLFARLVGLSVVTIAALAMLILVSLMSTRTQLID